MTTKAGVCTGLVLATLGLSACAAPRAAGPSVATTPPATQAAPEATKPAEEKPAGAASNAPTEITWLTIAEFAGVDDVLAEFEKDNPDIKVKTDRFPFNDFFQQLQIRLSAGSEEPCVLSVDVPLVAGYGIRNWLAPLDDVFTEQEKADWLPASVTAGTYNGKLIAAPESTSTQLLFYNKDLFDKAGITPPGIDERWTYEQVFDAAQKLKNQDTSGFSWEQTNRIYQLQPMEESLGGKAIGDDGLTVDGVINSKPWVDAYTAYGKAFNELGIAPKGNADVSALFGDGKLAMMIGGPWNIPRYIKANEGKGLPFNWGVSRHPYFKEGKVVTPTGSWHLGINAKCKNMDAAKRMVHWFTTGKGAETWWRKGSGDFPAQQSVLKLFQDDPQFKEGNWAYMKTAADEATQNPVPRPVTPGYLEYEQILQNTFDDIQNGTDAKQALDTAAERITREMQKYKK